MTKLQNIQWTKWTV